MIRSMMLGSVLVGLLLAVPAGAQDDSYPVSVVAGTCDDLGRVAIELEDAELADGRAYGVAAYLPSAQSYTTSDEPFVDILGGPHAVIVGDRAEPLACGNVGGNLDGSGGLTFGLRDESGETGITGVAYLGPAGDNPMKTYGQVSVFGAPSEPESAASAEQPSLPEQPAGDAGYDANAAYEAAVANAEQPVPVGAAAGAGGRNSAAVDALIGDGSRAVDGEAPVPPAPEATERAGVVTLPGWRVALIRLERAPDNEDNTVVALLQFDRLSGGEEPIPSTDIVLTDGSETYRTVGIVSVDGTFERGFSGAANLPFLEEGETVRVPILYFVQDGIDISPLTIQED